MSHSNSLRKFIPVLGVLLALFLVPNLHHALADYLGPDRIVREYHVETYDVGVWAEEGENCLDVNKKPSDCIICEWERIPQIASCASDLYYWYKTGTESEVVETITYLPEATIQETLLNCNLQNGWCSTAATLHLEGTEPLAGENILAIEGTLNGETFACQGSICDVPLDSGNNNFTFWALSSYGDSSQMGILSAQVDALPPEISGSISGTSGDNSWFTSSVEVSASATDAHSGLATLEVSVNNGGWTTYIAPLSFTEGRHQIQFRAESISELISFKIDTHGPHIKLPNSWYIWDGATFTVKDDTAKIISVSMEIADPQNRWAKVERSWSPDSKDFSQSINWNRVFADGILAPIGNYKVTVYAQDAAGNRNQKNATIKKTQQSSSLHQMLHPCQPIRLRR